MPASPNVRALIYVRGTTEEIAQQLGSLTEVCTRRGYQLVGIIRDPPDDDRGYHDAHRMLRDNQADLIIVSSATILPGLIESATGSLTGARVRAILRDVDARRRTRPIRRREAGGA